MMLRSIRSRQSLHRTHNENISLKSCKDWVSLWHSLEPFKYDPDNHENTNLIIQRRWNPNLLQKVIVSKSCKNSLLRIRLMLFILWNGYFEMFLIIYFEYGRHAYGYFVTKIFSYIHCFCCFVFRSWFVTINWTILIYLVDLYHL